jgi:hypothetical protein
MRHYRKGLGAKFKFRKMYEMIFTKMYSSMKQAKRMEDNFHPIFS